MSHPTRGPVRRRGIGGQAIGAGGRREVAASLQWHKEAET